MAVKGKYLILCKVRLADVIHCPKHRWDERRWFKSIGRYHVDFVLCDNAYERQQFAEQLVTPRNFPGLSVDDRRRVAHLQDDIDKYLSTLPPT